MRDTYKNEHLSDDDEGWQAAAWVLRPESWEQEGRGKGERDESRRGDGEPHLVSGRESERHGRILRGEQAAFFPSAGDA